MAMMCGERVRVSLSMLTRAPLICPHALDSDADDAYDAAGGDPNSPIDPEVSQFSCLLLYMHVAAFILISSP